MTLISKSLRDVFLQEPRKWLKKTLHVANVLLSLDSSPHHALADDMQVPLLCLVEGEVSTHLSCCESTDELHFDRQALRRHGPIMKGAMLLQVSALFPVFAVLERQTEGAYEGAIDLKLAPLVLSVTQSRLARLRGFVLGLVAALSVPEGRCALYIILPPVL